MNKETASPFTFLFTDIENSTQLWDMYPDAMKLALARHNVILRQAIESHHGHVFKIVGDAFHAVFQQADHALDAALVAQRALHAEAWDEHVRIKVRMALHTGTVTVADGDYTGPMLNRLARLMAAAYGEQTLVSAATRELLQNRLPIYATLRDMGERRLRGLSQAEHIYQLIVPDLPAEFPPLKTQDVFRTNLPAQLTSFIGREKEIAAIKQLVSANRLTTLTGPGGTGKSRLSLQTASTLFDSFPDGVWFVELASLADPARLPPTLMTTLGLREDGEHTPFEIVTSYLHAKTALLILDNCEHLIEASAQLVEALLHGCLYLHIITSSREALGITGEISFRVPSLSIPDMHQPPSLETSKKYESVRLFVDRAQATLPSFTLTDTNTFAVAQICARLDGIPLAIELAAARVKLLKVEQVAERLDDRFRLLTGGSRTALPRQQTLRAMIDWSYDLLLEAERTLLRRLSVFAGGWTLEAAETVGSNQGSVFSKQLPEERGLSLNTGNCLLTTDILDLLTQLVNKSLVVVDAESVETRYHLLETVRQYAREKLFETGEGIAIRNLHLQYFASFAERAGKEMIGPHIIQWQRQLEAELDNLRVALDWSLNNDFERGAQLFDSIAEFLFITSHIDVARHWLPQWLNHPKAQARTILRARLLVHTGFLPILATQVNINLHEALAISRELDDPLGIALGIYMTALQESDLANGYLLLLKSLAMYETIGNKAGMTIVLSTLGERSADYQQAFTYFDQSLAISREIGYISQTALTLALYGEKATWFKQWDVAHAYLNESLALQRQLGKGGNIVWTLFYLGQLSLAQGNYTQARIYYEDSLFSSEQIHDFPKNWVHIGLGYVALRQGDVAYARTLLSQSIQFFAKMSYTPGLVYALEGLTSLAVLQGQHPQAARLYAWIDATRKDSSIPRPQSEQLGIDRDLVSLRAALDESTFAEAQAAGPAMSIDEAITLALESTQG